MPAISNQTCLTFLRGVINTAKTLSGSQKYGINSSYSTECCLSMCRRVRGKFMFVR